MGAFDDITNKAKDLAGQHADQVDQGLDKAGDMVDEKTDGKYADKVDMGQEKAGDFLTGDQDGNG